MLMDKQIAREGSLISFQRNGFNIFGEVVKVKEDSVLVSISSADAKRLNIETPITVVSHKHYQLESTGV